MYVGVVRPVVAQYEPAGHRVGAHIKLTPQYEPIGHATGAPEPDGHEKPGKHIVCIDDVEPAGQK